MKRSAGVLLHITSLHSKYGVGTLGKAAYEFADFLKDSGQSFWQVLPIGPTGFGDSPYQSFSSFAGNPYLIDLDKISEDGFLKKNDFENLDWGEDDLKVNYGKLYENRFPLLRKAYKNAEPSKFQEFRNFKKENKDWLLDYSMYMALKHYFNEKPMSEWTDEDIRLRKKSAMDKYKKELKEDIDFWCFVQYLFFKQWKEFKKYVNSLGIQLIGDMPIYVANDSSDVWASPKNFLLDNDFKSTEVAGCPPDDFSPNGQLWGNPLYNWEYMKKSKYSWWIKRLTIAEELFDYIRIDHFRGFESYYAIPTGEETAKNGKWKMGPGMNLFNALNKAIPNLNIIAEDLGFISEEVKQLLSDSGYPGMKILQFAFGCGSNNIYLPHNYTRNCVVYTGTHDNDTTLGWLQNISDWDKGHAKIYCALNAEEGYVWGLIRTAYSSIADLAIIPMQDLLERDSSTRMNKPAVIGENWSWRISKHDLNSGLSKKMLELTTIYGREFKDEVKSDKELIINNKNEQGN